MVETDNMEWIDTEGSLLIKEVLEEIRRKEREYNRMKYHKRKQRLMQERLKQKQMQQSNQQAST